MLVFFTGGRVCGVSLTFVIWYLSVAAVRRVVYSLTIANLLHC